MARVYRDPDMIGPDGKAALCLDNVKLNGKRCRERTHYTLERDAEKLLATRLLEIAEAKRLGLGSVEALKPMTFSQFVETEYLPHQKATKRPGTYRRDVLLYNTVKGTFGGMLLSAIGANDVRKYITRRMGGETYKGTAPAPATINRERAFLSAALNAALVADYIERNPVAGKVKKLREDNTRDRWLTVEEERAILGQCPAWLEGIVTLAVHTGMRESEVCNLRWSDLDSVRKLIRVGQESKSHRTRYIPINSTVEALLARQTRHKGEAGPIPFVFVNPRTLAPYNASGVCHAFKDAACGAGFQDVVFHTMRHTFASRLVQAGVPDREIQRYLGHSSLSMVARYAHLAPLRADTSSLEVLAAGYGHPQNSSGNEVHYKLSKKSAQTVQKLA